MLIASIPVFVLLAGLLMIAFSANPKVVDIGRAMFFCGLLAVCLITARFVPATVFR